MRIVGVVLIAATSALSATSDPTGRYVELSQALLVEPPRLASLLSQRVVAGAPLPAASLAAGIVRQTRADLARLQALPLRDAALTTQRSRLAAGMRGLIPSMDAVTRALAKQDRVAVANAGNHFLERVRALPSLVAPASP